MSAAAIEASAQLRLHVAIAVAAPRLSSDLTEVVVRLGHRIVDVEQAEIVLCDAHSVIFGRPAIVIGANNSEHRVAGRLPTDPTSAQIDAALRAVAAGLIVHPGGATHGEFEELPARSESPLLTPRELQILGAISDGLTNKAIAKQLTISLHTVKFHVESLFRKLGVRTRAEAVAKGMEQRRRDLVQF
jgi:two-component system nitrate/nitrite response regulator NarL